MQILSPSLRFGRFIINANPGSPDFTTVNQYRHNNQTRVPAEARSHSDCLLTVYPRIDTDTPRAEAHPMPIARAWQKPGSSIDVEFRRMDAKIGGHPYAIIRTPQVGTTPGKSFVALQGSHLHFPGDTDVELPGLSIQGKITNRLANHIDEKIKPQTVTDQALLLCGGESTRFYPLAGKDLTNLPKPAVPLIGNESIALNIIEHLKKHGIKKVLVHTSFLSNQMRKDLEKATGVSIVYINNQTLPGDAGVVYMAMKEKKVNLQKPLLIIAGDAVTNGNLSELINAHDTKNAGLSIGVQQVAEKDVSQFGIMKTNAGGTQSGEVVEFMEKPSLAKAGENRMGSTGIYVLGPRLYTEFYNQGDAILNPANPRYDDDRLRKAFMWGQDFIPDTIAKSSRLERPAGALNVLAEEYHGYWNDAGNPDAYMETLRDISNGHLGADAAKRLNKNYYDSAKGVVFWPTNNDTPDSVKKWIRQQRISASGNVIATGERRFNNLA